MPTTRRRFLAAVAAALMVPEPPAWGDESGEAYRAELRRRVERRRRRRATRGRRPVGAIVPWPMPPALIIRQTPEVHGETRAVLGGLRR